MAGKALISVPMIALINGAIMCALVLLTYSQSDVLSLSAALRANFAGTTLISFAVGVALAPIFVVLGGFIPRPKVAWLMGIAIAVCITGGIAFAGSEPGLIVFMTALGVVDALLWWLLVERHRSFEGESA